MCDSWSVATRLYKCRIKPDPQIQASTLITCHGNPNTWQVGVRRTHTHYTGDRKTWRKGIQTLNTSQYLYLYSLTSYNDGTLICYYNSKLWYLMPVILNFVDICRFRKKTEYMGVWHLWVRVCFTVDGRILSRLSAWTGICVILQFLLPDGQIRVRVIMTQLFLLKFSANDERYVIFSNIMNVHFGSYATDQIPGQVVWDPWWKK
jgi:hypothetical protein